MQGDAYDESADVYSFGLVICHLACQVILRDSINAAEAFVGGHRALDLVFKSTSQGDLFKFIKGRFLDRGTSTDKKQKAVSCC